MTTHDLPFSFEDADESTGFLLWQITAIWQREIAAALRPHEITHGQFVLMAGLLWLSSQQPQVTQVMLAKHTKTDTMTTSQVLRTLEGKGYLERVPHPEDTRAKCLSLTKTGKKKVFSAIPDVEAVDKKFFQPVAAKIKELNKTMHLLLKNH